MIQFTIKGQLPKINNTTNVIIEELISWKGELPIKKYMSGRGYKRLDFKGKKVLEHRYIMEQHLNRKLLNTEVVHHINGIRDDNRIENLQVMTLSEHSRDCARRLKGKKHYHLRTPLIKCYCCGCGRTLLVRRIRNNRIFCDSKCYFLNKNNKSISKPNNLLKIKEVNW